VKPLPQQFTNKYREYFHHPTREGQTPGVAADICVTVEGKEEIEDTSDPEPSRIKHEDTEEQKGWCPFFILDALIDVN